MRLNCTSRTHVWAVLGIAVAGGWMGRPADASVQIITNGSVAPVPVDAMGNLNPTFITWNNNAVAALQAGTPTGGDTTSPAGYVAAGPAISRAAYFSTQGDASAAPLPGASPFFPSWNGTANPPGAFGTEHGSALFFPARIVGNGQKIELANLSNVTTSNDPTNFWGPQGTGLANNNNYSFFRVGIVYGPSGKPGPDETIYNNGQSGSTPVDEIDYSGVAVWQQASSSYGGSNQNQIDQSVAAFYTQFPMTQITNSYKITDGAGTVLAQASVTENLVPEPACASAIVGIASVLVRRRRAW